MEITFEDKKLEKCALDEMKCKKKMGTNQKFRAVYAFHPGITLREKLNEMDMSVKEFALRTTKPEKTINAVLTGESAVTPDMSIAFEQITQIPAHFWLNLQRNYDEYVARQKREAICRDEATIAWAKKFPYNEMAKLNWVPTTRIIAEKIINLFSFFKVNSVTAWEDYYFNQKLKSSFRISLSSTRDPYSMSAWLRQGEILADNLKLENSYSENSIKSCIPQLKQLVMEQPADFSLKIFEICSSVGIKIICMKHISHAPVNGCTRWIGDVPCVQMTDRQKRNDVFWFSLFHELGHIALHGKKDLFIENDESRALEKEKEAEADKFAADNLLSLKAETEIIQALNGNLPTQQFILAKAKQHKTHPAIIVGRLQHRQIIPQNSPLNNLKIAVELPS